MQKLTEKRALVVALIVSGLSLSITLASGLLLRAVSFGTQSGKTESSDLSRQTASQGRQIFVKRCVECHGFDARGDEGSDLYNLRIGDALTRQIIAGGIKGEMPAYRKVLGEAEVRALVTYLRTLRN